LYRIVPKELEGSLKRQFGYYSKRLQKWCGEDKFITLWRSRLKDICQCNNEEDKEAVIKTIFKGESIYYIPFERSLNEDLLYPLTCEELISFADKKACSTLTKRQESDYDNYDFIQFFKSIHDEFLNDMKANKYHFFDDDDDILVDVDIDNEDGGVEIGSIDYGNDQVINDELGSDDANILEVNTVDETNVLDNNISNCSILQVQNQG